MLDVMRKYSRSFVIYVFFGIIIAVFIVNFGPQSAGCTSGTSHAAQVDGRPISQVLFNYAVQQYTMRLAQFRMDQLKERDMIQLRAIVMDELLKREILAEEALKQGFRISDKEIDDMIVKGRFLMAGQPHMLRRNAENKFDYDLFAREVRYQGLNVMKFKGEQRRELLAEKMSQYLASLVKVSEDEVSADFMVRNSQAELNYVRFAPADYRGRVLVDEAKVNAWLAGNKKRVEDYYKDNQAAFQKLPKQIRLQVIEVKTATDKPAAKAKAEQALGQITGGEPFAKVAATASDEADSRGAGGLLGWRNEDSPGIEPAVSKAAAALKNGELSAVLEGKGGYWIIKVIGRRSGNLSLAQAERDIAEDLYRTDGAIELAKQDAVDFIKRAKAGEKLADMFTSDLEDKAGEPTSQPSEPKKTEAAPIKPRSPLKLASTSMFSRSGRYLVPGIGVSKEAMGVAFKLKKGQVADHPIVVGQMVYLVALADRKDADPAEWARRRDDLMEEFASQKAARIVRQYVHQRCEAAVRAKDIRVNPGALVTPGYVAEKKDPLPSFAPCSSMKERES